MNSHWDQLYQQLVQRQHINIKYPPADEIDNALNACEQSLSIKFPASYRGFIHTFGPGELIGWFRIMGPHLASIRKRHDLEILDENKNWRDPKGFWADTAEPGLRKRAVFFCTTGGGDAYLWDPFDQTDELHHEYAIYELDHSSMDANVCRVASSFVEFINDFCLIQMWKKLQDPEDPDESTPEYWSTWPTRKIPKKPSRRSPRKK